MTKLNVSKLGYSYEMHKTLRKQKIILVYEGYFTQDITNAILRMTELNESFGGEEEMMKRKIFNVMVECLQNICKHADADHESEDKRNSILILGKTDENYFITTGNYIYKKNIPALEEGLKHINTLDKDGLKKLFKEIRSGGDVSGAGGAGLGLVDIARKSGRQLDYNFANIDDRYSYFPLQASIVSTLN
ncbi:MAG: SiaB family protein kinase [Bacteroidia bacterium]|nr:SiaB family protein kinase [Bacteroidia bacterium]